MLVTALLEAVSGLEPQVMNYLSLHTASSQAAQEKVILITKRIPCVLVYHFEHSAKSYISRTSDGDG